jgi:hypothetical protein
MTGISAFYVETRMPAPATSGSGAAPASQAGGRRKTHRKAHRKTQRKSRRQSRRQSKAQRKH